MSEITQEQRAEWRRLAEQDVLGGPRTVALLDALEAAERERGPAHDNDSCAVSISEGPEHGACLSCRLQARDVALSAMQACLDVAERERDKALANLDQALLERIPFAEEYSKPIRARAEAAEAARDQAVHVAAKEVAEAVIRLATMEIAGRVVRLEQAVSAVELERNEARRLLINAIDVELDTRERVEKAEADCQRLVDALLGLRCAGGHWSSDCATEALASVMDVDGEPPEHGDPRCGSAAEAIRAVVKTK